MIGMALRWLALPLWIVACSMSGRLDEGTQEFLSAAAFLVFMLALFAVLVLAVLDEGRSTIRGRGTGPATSEELQEALNRRRRGR